MFSRLAALLLLCSLCATSARAEFIILRIKNFEAPVGRVHIFIYDNAADWLTGNVIQQRTMLVDERYRNGQVVARMKLDAGTYAIAVHHDANDNGVMDYWPLGIRREPLGVSNADVTWLSEPGFDEAAFLLGPELLDVDVYLP